MQFQPLPGECVTMRRAGGELGYDLHITRRNFWADDDGQAITLEEWLVYVALDVDIEADPQNPGPENYVIASHPDRWPLRWHRRRGEVYTKNPDDLVVAKLVQIARALNARVLGDDDEIYGIDPSDPLVFERR